jgi:hypothetical protein
MVGPHWSITWKCVGPSLGSATLGDFASVTREVAKAFLGASSLSLRDPSRRVLHGHVPDPFFFSFSPSSDAQSSSTRPKRLIRRLSDDSTLMSQRHLSQIDANPQPASNGACQGYTVPAINRGALIVSAKREPKARARSMQSANLLPHTTVTHSPKSSCVPIVLPPPTTDSADLPQDEAQSELVSSSRPPRTQHEYSLDGSDKPWLKLNVSSHASSPSSVPVFIEGDPIAGSVEVDVSKLANIQEITLSVSPHKCPISKLRRLTCQVP